MIENIPTEVIIPILCIALPFFTLPYLGDYIVFNKGVCKKCGGKVHCFDMDSQGGRGYSCNECDHSFWISYPVDRKYKE